MSLAYDDQIRQHINFLKSHDFDVDKIQVDAGFIRCRAIGHAAGRGELCYKTTSSRLSNGALGLATWCRCLDGERHNFQTHSSDDSRESIRIGLNRAQLNQDCKTTNESNCDNIAASRRSYGFWEYSAEQGYSDYLENKKAGAYGIRFRSSDEYGNVAVVPMRDVDGFLWSYQLLNPNGRKIMAPGTRTLGLMHAICPFQDGDLVGIAESYVTAATCYELAGIPTVCAFSSSNLMAVTRVLAERYPRCHLLMLADNDRHLATNEGVEKARKVVEELPDRTTLAVPDFGNHPPGKDASDWNDLVRIEGMGVAAVQLEACIELAKAKRG